MTASKITPVNSLSVHGKKLDLQERCRTSKTTSAKEDLNFTWRLSGTVELIKKD